MIHSAEEFVRLRISENMDQYLKAAWDEAPFKVWLDIIKGCPDMRKWVAHNKSIPVEIKEILAGDADDRVRFIVQPRIDFPDTYN